jgi:hypothetical protein
MRPEQVNERRLVAKKRGTYNMIHVEPQATGLSHDEQVPIIGNNSEDSQNSCVSSARLTVACKKARGRVQNQNFDKKWHVIAQTRPNMSELGTHLPGLLEVDGQDDISIFAYG